MTARELGEQPAFPIFVPESRNAQGTPLSSFCIYGLTKREEIAKAMMQGIVSSCPEGLRMEAMSSLTLDVWSRVAVRMADALLAELAKERL